MAVAGEVVEEDLQVGGCAQEGGGEGEEDGGGPGGAVDED